MTTPWEEIKDGWGLVQIPHDLKKELCCCMCNRPNRVLWTDQSTTIVYDCTKPGSYQRARRALLEKLRNRTFCKYHAKQYFGD